MKIQTLIVDDEPQSVQILQDNINWKKLGIEGVYGAYSAQEAREIMEQQPVQIILCDIEMPGENGLEFIQWLREESNLNGRLAECIILTCYPDYAYMRKAMQIGCSDYLIKPVEPAEVEQVVFKAIRKVWEQADWYREPSGPANERAGAWEGSGSAKKAKWSDPRLQNTEDGIFAPPEAEQDIIEDLVIPFIREHYTEMLTVSEIAAHAALNPQYMMRLFKKRTGSSVLEYVTSLRLDTARELLRKTDWTNDFIAEKVGYASPNYFIKLFKTQFGMTPREFRKKEGKIPG